jgi:thermostable 8-oxoguanine DNA glycosylase
MARSKSMEIVPTAILMSCNDLVSAYMEPTWDRLSEGDLWNDLVLRILSSQTRWENAAATRDRLRAMGHLDALRMGTLAHRKLAEVLSAIKPGVRWPSRKAEHLWQARQCLYRHGRGIRPLLTAGNAPDDVRSKLVNLVPGVGMKQASHFLQSIGYASGVAVLDRHLIGFLEARRPGSSRASYRAQELSFQALAAHLYVSPPILDFAVWNYMRHDGTCKQ